MTALARDVLNDSSTFESAGGRLVSPDGRLLPLRSAHLEVEARGGIARVILTQRFSNPGADPLAVHYALPLPADGAVSGFAFTVSDRRIVGEVDRRAQARARFEKAILEGRTAALVEQARDSVFTQELGNVPPQTDVVCEVVIDQPLRWLEEGRWEWRFPTVVGARYMGAQGLVPDGASITVDVANRPLPAQMTLVLAIGDTGARGVDSPTHPLSISENAELEVRFEGDGGVRLDRDVAVHWVAAHQDAGVELDAARPAEGNHDGTAYGLLTVTPPLPASVPKNKVRDLICLMDVSGSMGGRPLDQAKRVVAALIDGLAATDRVELIAFGNRPRRFKTEPIVASRAGKQAAMKWVRGLQASGATEMHTAILEALHPLRPKAQRQVVLLTDGYIGFEKMIISQLLGDLPPESRLHVVGVGSAVNRTLTKGAARAGGGVELIIGLDEDAEKVAFRLLRRTEAPLVTGLTVEGPAVKGTAPVKLPDLFAGCPALLSVALDATGGELVLRGDTLEGPYERRIEAPALTLGEGRQGVVSLYGREHVEDLETALSAGGAQDALDAQIEETGLTFGLSTRLTSWIAITEERLVDRDMSTRRVNQPQEAPYGVSVASMGLRAASAVAAPAFRGAPPEREYAEEIASAGAVFFSLAEMPDDDELSGGQVPTGGGFAGGPGGPDSFGSAPPSAPPKALRRAEPKPQARGLAQPRSEAPSEVALSAESPKHRGDDAPVPLSVASPASLEAQPESDMAPPPMEPMRSVGPESTGRSKKTSLVWMGLIVLVALVAWLMAWMFGSNEAPNAPTEPPPIPVEAPVVE